MNDDKILRNIASQIINIQEDDLTTAEKNIARILVKAGIIRQRIDLTYELPPEQEKQDNKTIDPLWNLGRIFV
jgi:hypothetical protein